MNWTNWFATSQRWRGVMPAVAGVFLFFGGNPASGATLYSTGFNNPPFETSTYFWAGVDGWNSTDPSNGTAAVTSDGGAVYLGAVAPADATRPAAAWRSLEIDPLALGLPIVKITTRLRIHDSTNSKYDLFAFALYNKSGGFISALLLDNYGLIFGYDDGSGTQTLSGKFTNESFFTIVMTINLATNRASAKVVNDDGTVRSLFDNRVFHSQGRALNLGEFDYLWLLNASGTAGDNAMVIDSLAIEAFPNPALVLSRNGRIKTHGDAYTLRGGQGEEDNVRIQWRTKDHKRWSAVRGATTRWLLTLKKLKPGRNVVQLRMLDVLGREINRRSVVIVRL